MNRENVDPLPVESATLDFFRSAVAGAMDAVVVTTADLAPPGPTIVYVNEAFERMTGYAAEEVLGRSPRVLQGPSTDPETLAQLRQELGAGRGFYGKATNYRKDGSEYYVEWRITPVRSEGRVTNWVAIQRDVTREVLHEREIQEARRLLAEANERLEERVAESTADLRRIVEELRTTNEELAANNRDMATFTYTVSHDLRQPARAIIANARFLEEDHAGELSPPARELVERQTTAASRLGRLIDDLLRMSRLGRTAVVRERVDVEDLVRLVWEELEDRDGDATLIVQPGLVAEASRSLLGVVLQNLLGNALKFRAPDRPLVVEVGGLPDGAFFVRDNGSGFDPVYAARIFEPFERLHRMDVEGSGFGLHNAQRIAEQHGGRMWAEGTEGQGATFFFTLDEGSDPDAG